MTHKRRYTGQQPRTKSGRRPADKPVINRRFCSSIGLHRNLFLRASVCCSGLPPSMPWGARGAVVSPATRPVGILSCSAPHSPAAAPCAAPSRPARGMSGLWIRHVKIHAPLGCLGYAFNKWFNIYIYIYIYILVHHFACCL